MLTKGNFQQEVDLYVQDIIEHPSRCEDDQLLKEAPVIPIWYRYKTLLKVTH